MKSNASTIKPEKRVPVKGEAESRGNDLLDSIRGLAGDLQNLAREAARRYAVEVEAILVAQSRDPVRIERCIDGMLDFVFSDDVLALYKKLCRYYFGIDPEATVSYVNSYRDLWGDESPKTGRPGEPDKGARGSR